MADLTQKINRIANNVAETYSVLEAMGAPMPANANSDNLSATAASIKVVKSMTYDAETNKWTLTYTDNTTETVEGPSIPQGFSGSWNDLTDKPSTFPPSAHTQAASTILAGTFAGQVKANASGQAPGVYCQRNQKVSLTAENPTVNGEICWLAE